MCGIYLTNIPFKEIEIKNKLQKMKYRGPDHTGILKLDDINLGHLRLSILDLDTRSNQPFQHKHFTMVYNGEIYNFKDIRTKLEILGYSFKTTSDTEVLIKGYEAWGENVLSKLNGMFAFAIYDSQKKEIFCARDRLGVKPFYYYWNEGEFEICSQLKPLINSKSKISKKAVSIFLDYGYVPSPYSILESVFKLQPGKFLIISLNDKTRKIHEYWNLKQTKTLDISYEDAKKQVKELLKDAVKIRMQSDVPLGTFLSGGIDSALVTAMASQMSFEKIKTFTIGFEDPEFDESKVAEKFSSILDTDHTTTVCSIEDILKLIPELFEMFDEPFADNSALPSLLLNKITKQDLTVALSGDGGDESFLGYGHFDKLQKFKTISKIPYAIRKQMVKLPLNKILKKKKETYESVLLSKDSFEFSKNIFSRLDSIQLNKFNEWEIYYNEKFTKNSTQFLADYNIKLWLENDSNVKVDRASMANSVEVRSPFLDYRIIELARTLPINYRYQKDNKKRISKDILEEFIPRDVFELPKKGFSVPLEKWIRNDLRQDILLSLNDDFLSSVPNLNVKKFKSQLNNHMQNKNNYTFNIWKLYVLHGWMRSNKLNF